MRPYLFAAAVAFVPCAASFAATVAIERNQNFDSIGTDKAAALPAGWHAAVEPKERFIGGYEGAGAQTSERGGENLSNSAGFGIYNFGSGNSSAATTSTDRAVGFLATGSGGKSGNLFYKFTASDTFTSLAINYAVEAYRSGSNSAGFQFALSYSSDGTSWTSAGSAFTTSFTGTPTAGYPTAPGMTVPVSGTLNFSGPNLTAGSTFYLAWNYSVITGNTVTNAWALAIDDVTINGITPTASAVPLPLAAPAGLGLLGAFGLVRRRFR